MKRVIQVDTLINVYFKIVWLNERRIKRKHS